MAYNMLGHPTTNAAPLISLAATSGMASEPAKFTLLSQTTTTMLLSNHTQATQSAPPLSSIARTLTRYFFGETTLPSYLQPYGHLLLGFTGGAAAATALYSFLQRNKDDRKKIQLAVYHVVRVLKDMPDLEERIKTPGELLAMISEEVNHMIDVHLTRSEGAATISQVKHKVETDLDERVKRQRMDNAAVEDEDDALFDRPGENVQFAETHVAGGVPEAVFQSPFSSSDRDGRSSQELQLPQEEDLDLDMSMLDYDSLDEAQVPASYGTPAGERSLSASPGSDQDSNESLPPWTTRPSNPTPRRGRGDVYESDDTPSSQLSKLASPRDNAISHDEDSEPVVESSNPTPRHDQASSLTHTDTPRPKTSSKASHGLGKEYDEISLSPALRKENSPVGEVPPTLTTTKAVRGRHETPHAQNRPKITVKPRSTISLHQPPSTLAVKTEGAVNGSWLFSLREGLSPHVSPAVDTTQYRVAETRKLHKSLEEERGDRRRFKKWIPTTVSVPREVDEETPNAVQKEEQEEQEEVDADVTLPDIISISSGSDDEDEDEQVIASSPPKPATPSAFHEGEEVPSSSSPLPTIDASPTPHQTSSPPAAEPSPPASESASPRDSPVLATGSSSKRVIRSTAPSPPERHPGSGSPPRATTRPLEAPQTHVDFKTPRARRSRSASKAPARSKTEPTPGTRKSARVAARARGEKK
ncbi:hypothetical protein ACET3X_005730 [Alternaria dauci]|uniref:Uncharacterized protein n=1 Tax=Alternaria dauci TaxID=48095 RepID=A0ABR3UG83_9PLEO